MRSSRLPGFYKMDVDARRELISSVTGATCSEIADAVDHGGLSAETADKIVENVIGIYALPMGLALNVQIDGEDHVVPMVVEEPSVIAAASNAAKMVREGGGFTSEIDEPLMISQIELRDIASVTASVRALHDRRDELLACADTAVPGLVARGGGARDIEVRILDATRIVLHVIVDCREAMGANLVNAVAEHVAPLAAEIARARIGLRILSNLCDQRLVRVQCRVPFEALATETICGETVAEAIEEASRFAEIDPYRAATHNKGIMNGVDPVVIATGNDWRAVEAGAHAYAARDGRYQPLATWRATETALVGEIELPMALGTVGGTLRVHPAARIALRILGMPNSGKLGAIAAAVGLASNLAALRALATDGIQRGHMSLHARSVAVAAGSPAKLVDSVARMIVEARDITLDGARRALQSLPV